MQHTGRSAWVGRTRSSVRPLRQAPFTPDTVLNCVLRAVIMSWLSGHLVAALDFHLGSLRGSSSCAGGWQGCGRSPQHAPPRPWGSSSLLLASFLSCPVESCCFCSSSDFNKLERQIPLSPLFSCQLFPHLSNKVLVTSTYSQSALCTPFLQQYLNCRVALWL